MTTPMTVGILGDASGLRSRLRAASIHLTCCVAVASLVLALVFLAWYPAPLHRIAGVEAILMIMLGADVALGPLVTLVVYDRAKKRLWLDLAAVITVQLAALVYGLYAVHEGRPGHLVFVKDRFELIAPADIEHHDREAARENAAAALDALRPKWVAARMPAVQDERQRILFEAIERGKDVQHHPRLYEPYWAQAQAAVARGQSLETLRRYNPLAADQIDRLPAALGVPAESLRYLPLRGPHRDGAVIIRAETGAVLRVLALQPW